MTIAELFQAPDKARRAALEQYAKEHDRFSELEQLHAGRGEHVLAEGAHVYALRALKAFRAELDDRPPEVLS